MAHVFSVVFFLDGFHGQIAGFVGSGTMEMQVTDVTGSSTLHLKKGDMKLSILDNPRQVVFVISGLDQ